MESNERNKKNAMKPNPHRIDEKHPDIFLNVDLVRKEKPIDQAAQKTCNNCCDQCKSKTKKEGREQSSPVDK